MKHTFHAQPPAQQVAAHDGCLPPARPSSHPRTDKDASQRFLRPPSLPRIILAAQQRLAVAGEQADDLGIHLLVVWVSKTKEQRGRRRCRMSAASWPRTGLLLLRRTCRSASNAASSPTAHLGAASIPYLELFGVPIVRVCHLPALAKPALGRGHYM